MRIFGELEGMAQEHVTEEATADELANVAFALEHGDLTDDELRAMFERYRGRWSIERALRKVAAERKMFLPTEPHESFARFADVARERCKFIASNRWHGMGQPPVDATPADVLARDLLQVMRGTDLFGRPFDYSAGNDDLKGAEQAHVAATISA